jgi:LmbE family N-acetylglucosaminyl deacetylase
VGWKLAHPLCYTAHALKTLPHTERLMPETPPLYIPQRALFIYAHPDDIEFSVAGTAALWAAHGCAIAYVVITDGNIGTHDPDMTAAQLTALRHAEQRASADLVGVHDVRFLGYPDGMLQPTLELRRDLVREIRRFRPNVVVTGDPTVFFPRDNYINHPDHRAAATAAIEACFPAPESPLIFPELLAEGLAPHRINHVFISWPREGANLYVDISSTLALKLAALKLHASQLRGWDPTELLTEWSARAGEPAGIAHAEVFRRMTLFPEPEEG